LQKLAEQSLASWNGQMAVGSAGASIWWTFWTEYLSEVFKPWWAALKVPVHLDRAGLMVGPGLFSLDEDLEAWTVGDQPNAAFSPPGVAPRTAQEVMRTAFEATADHLSVLLGGGPGRWQWGKLHTREFPSLTQAVALGYGPRPAGGDLWTVDAAEGGTNSEIGPSWRMIVGWSGVGRPVAEGIYPGGQSEDPASPWYSNLIADWWAGSYLPMPDAGAGGPGSAAAGNGGSASGGVVSGAGSSAGTVHWELRP